MREQSFKTLQWRRFGLDEGFSGYQSRFDKGLKKSRGYLVPSSKNVEVLEDGTIRPRKGIAILGSAGSSSAGTNLMKFKRKNGGNDILLRTYSTVVEYYSEHTSQWETLLTGLTSGLYFGYEQMDYSDDTGTQPSDYTFVNLLIFGNGTDTSRSWLGATAKIASTTSNTIVIDGDDDISALNPTFPSSGTLIINGNSYTYSFY